MATKHYENGIVGASEGGSTDISTDIFVTGDVIWVDSVNGNDSNAGTNRNSAKATLASAISVTASNNGDIIIIESGHTESISSSLTIGVQGLRIFGLGSGSNKPNFTVTAATQMFDLTSARIELHNLRFPAGTTIANTSRINVQGAACRIVDCDFICGQYDLESIQVPDAADDLEINGCTFTITADGPDAAIEIEAAAVLGLKVIGCTFDGGSFDFDAAAINSGVAHTEFLYRNCILTNKASIIHTAASKGQCVGVVAGDGSRVEV